MKTFSFTTCHSRLVKLSTSSLLALSLSVPAANAWQWGDATNDTSYQQLKSQAQTARTQLIQTINQAEQQGLNTDYANVSKVVIDLFLRYAEFDRQNPQVIQAKIDAIWWNEFIPNNYAQNIPFEELKDSITVAERAVEELQAQMNGSLVLQTPFDFSSGPVVLKGDKFTINDQAVYPSSFNWLPSEDNYIDAFGRIGGDYYPVAELKESGGLHSWSVSGAVEELQKQNSKYMDPKVFFLGYNASTWQKNAAPEAFETGRYFVPFDIDNSSIRSWYQQLMQHYIPGTKDQAGQGTRVHLLANEPHFSTREGGWLADNGVSATTKQKYQDWLQQKYSSISDLNQSYGTQYANFTQAKNGLVLPIAKSLQGGPIWYDWCKFNMARVTEWFSFLKRNVQQHDPQAKVTIKILGWIMSSEWRDHGIDIEALAKLQDVMGSDFSMGPKDLVNFKNKEFEFRERYSIEWVEQSRGLDFYRSIAPNKPFYDSEWHGLSAEWQHFDMEPNYVRASLWLAHTHGMKMNTAWVWGRKDDGDPSSVNSIFVSEPTTQPLVMDAYGRTMKELNAHTDSFNQLVDYDTTFRIFYSEDSAIQDGSYIGKLTKVYEALKMLNVDVGFTTASELSNVGANNVIIIPPTPYLSYWEYKALQDNAAEKILVDRQASFVKNQHGKQRNQPQMPSYADITFSGVYDMADELASNVNALAKQRVVDFQITDMQNQAAYGVFVRQATDNNGDTILSIINVSKDKRKLRLELPNKVKDLVTGNMLSQDFELAPYDVYLVKTSQQATADNSLSSITVPATINAGQQLSVGVNYSANAQQNLELHLVSRTTWASVAKQQKVVYSASNKNTWFGFEVPSDIPSGDYEFRAMLIPEGQTWREAHDILNQRVVVSENQNGSAIPSDWTNLELAHSGRCFDLTGGNTANGTGYQQWDCNTSNLNQRFKFVPVSDGWYLIQSQRSDKCVDLDNGSTADGAKVQQWSCMPNNQNQHWKINPKDNGRYELIARKSNKCIDAEGKATTNGTPLVQWSCYNGDNQQFTFK
ncbi:MULTISPECIES: RICIN domain-containing protein [unclassified Agarivorans]|uniref:RICIN domain-containing protein n=1 Tax=unclassified Agarivorans TaxID=2636026 RepID=UPI0026E179A7|nr:MULTISPECIES: RICIN domain-containing protein [unclassified Agarivorans]MDO6685011.1 RICIN domain-containing protein [Agarivorans sp. 3_MG-2023]MDO6717431.1 RICIN domain-containing protein [Agarivorans sp. 2_MG-2023]